MSLTTQCPEGFDTSLQASQSLMRVLEPYDWATNAIERARLELQPYNKLLSAAALALQSYCSRISRQQDERRHSGGNVMTHIRYVNDGEQNDDHGAVPILYEKPLAQPQFAFLRHTILVWHYHRTCAVELRDVDVALTRSGVILTLLLAEIESILAPVSFQSY
jgi:hypothetical protein